MPVIQIGNLSANYQPDGDNVHQDAMGAGEATLTYKVTAVGFNLSQIPRPLSPHPVYGRLKLFEANAAREAGEWMAVTCTYRGVIISNPLIYMQEQFTVSTSSEPVETHPLFAFPLDNPPVTPDELSMINRYIENNLVYSGAVAGSTANGVLLFEKKRRGINSFLRIGGVYRQSYISAIIPQDYNGIGKIQKVPAAPALPVGMNWLWTAYNWRKAGGVVSIELEYTMSGRGGWDVELYDPAFAV